MPKPSLEQDNANLRHALEVAMYWLLRSVHANYDTDCDIRTFLDNHGLHPTSKEAKALLKRCPEAYHHELEAAVKRSVR